MAQDSPEARNLRKIPGILKLQEGLARPQEASGGPKTGSLGVSWGFLRASWKPSCGLRWLKIVGDGLRWLKIAPKPEDLVKYEGFWGFERALQAPRRLPEGPRQALWGLLGAS